MIATHAFNMSGEFWAELKDSFGPIEDEIRRLLHRLNGADTFSFILWKLPEGKALDDTQPDEEADEYMQSAGSAEGMTVELRRVTNGSPAQFVVGRPADSAEQHQSVEVRWSGSATVVNPNEVFDAVEAADLFVSYYYTGNPPPGYVLRRLDL